VVPAVPRLVPLVRDAVAAWPVAARIVTDAAEKDAAFRTARAALTKSGTSTLELAVAGVPMVAAYKVPLIEEAIARLLIKVDTAILANLVLGEKVVPEFLQRDCTAEQLAAALAPLLSDTAQRRAQLAAFARLDRRMEIGSAVPSARAAALVLAAAGFNQAAAKASTAPPRQE
jgi:lipid-A-disaccharide synthase